jgi:hypothetical protein
MLRSTNVAGFILRVIRLYLVGKVYIYPAEITDFPASYRSLLSLSLFYLFIAEGVKTLIFSAKSPKLPTYLAAD